ncbi:MAG: TspO/MBR family protein [Candidatus Coprovivens sp.]
MKKIMEYMLVILPLVLGIIVSAFVDFNIYGSLNKPDLAPPAVVFPIVWTILYVLMGVSLYMNRNNKKNMVTFFIQLMLNYLWVFVFFGMQSWLGGFIVIILLDVMILYTILEFYKENKLSAYMLIPYLLWCIFASYLNFQIFLLN